LSLDINYFSKGSWVDIGNISSLFSIWTGDEIWLHFMDIWRKVFALVWWEHKTFAIASNGYLVKLPRQMPRPLSHRSNAPFTAPKARLRPWPGKEDRGNITYVYCRISRHLWQSTSNLAWPRVGGGGWYRIRNAFVLVLRALESHCLA